MKRFAALLAFCFTVAFCRAQLMQDSLPVNIASIIEDSNLVSRTLLYIDSGSSLSAAEVLHKQFAPLESFKLRKKIPPEMVSCTFFLKIYIRNNSEKEVEAYIYPGSRFRQTDLYKLADQPVEISESDKDKIDGYKKIKLTAGEQCYILVALKPLKNELTSLNSIFINAGFIGFYTEFLIGHKNNIQIFGFILSGVLLMMILFMVTNFLISYKVEFLYNTLYSLCMFLLIFFNTVLAKVITPIANLYFSFIDFSLLVAGSVFYITFIRKFLNTKNDYMLLDKILKYGVNFIIVLMCIYTYLHFFTNTYLPQYQMENLMRFFLLGIGVAFIYLAIKQRNRLFNYIAAGNAMLVICSVISFGLIRSGIKPGHIYTSALFYYYLGIVLELTFFLLGLTYKNRSELILRTQEQEAMKLEAEKKEFETQIAVIKAQQEERNRISADMHDDLGAGMTTIRLYSELAKSKLPDNPIPEIDKISSSANELLNKMNAIIWSMSSSNDSLGNMIAYIRSYAIEYFENTGITCRISIPENLPNIEVIGEIRRNVFLVVKEALNNVLKHSQATEVVINLVRIDDELILYIQDNGIGIDLEKLRQFGNGLKNMKKRMADVNIEFTIENKNGTLITLRRKVLQF